MSQKTALITGGNKGIGLAATRLLLESGWKVVVVARDFSNFEFSRHQDVQSVQFDLSDVHAIADVAARLPEVDVLVNNAGIMHGIKHDEYTEEKKNRLLRINLEAPIALMSAFGPRMAKRGGGRMINLGSIAGQTGHPDVWYGVSKAGLMNATKSFAKTFGGQGVVVNAIAPGPVETEMLAIIPEERLKLFRGTIFRGSFASAEEIAKIIYWLAVDAPSFVTGTCIDANGGTRMI